MSIRISDILMHFLKLQAAASDEMANKFLALHSYEKCRPFGGFMDSVYHANASVVSHDENLYRFEHVSSPLCQTINTIS